MISPLGQPPRRSEVSSSVKDAKDLGSSLVRKVANRQLIAVRGYADTLQGYVDGKKDIIEFGKDALNLGVSETVRNTEDFLRFGFELCSKALSFSGVKLGEAASNIRAQSAKQ
jgi:hypothetical protein